MKPHAGDSAPNLSVLCSLYLVCHKSFSLHHAHIFRRPFVVIALYCNIEIHRWTGKVNLPVHLQRLFVTVTSILCSKPLASVESNPCLALSGNYQGRVPSRIEARQKMCAGTGDFLGSGEAPKESKCGSLWKRGKERYDHLQACPSNIMTHMDLD